MSEKVDVNDLHPSHPDSNFFGKQDFLKELRVLFEKSDNIECKKDVEFIDSELNRLDEKYDFSFWSGRGEQGDDPHIFSLVDEITLAALRYSDKHSLGVEVMGYDCAVDYEVEIGNHDDLCREEYEI